MNTLVIENSARPFEDLANAIVYRAAKDYKKTMSKLAKDQEVEEMGDKKETLEKFFRSEWYCLLTNVDGEMLIQRLGGGVKRARRSRAKNTSTCH